jgi:ergothioneine biosynthesis protein EgtC
MCRFLAYMGEPIILNDLLYRPKNSLICQSFNAKELEEPLNGDGFGIGWYVHELDDKPAVFVSTQPAWSNRNLRSIAPCIKTSCLIAHVRAASVGEVTEANCHPFNYGKFLMMHNGGIENFNKMKRTLRSRLSDTTYTWIKGQTDSEHFYALFLDKILPFEGKTTVHLIADALEKSLQEINEIKKQHGMTDASYFNLCVTDGTCVVAARYVTHDDHDALTLYHSRGGKYECQEDGFCKMVHDDNEVDALLIVSEKLTDVEDDWQTVPRNHFVMISSDQKIQTRAINA